MGRLRTSHGALASSGRLVVTECPPADEMPAGVPAEARTESPRDRGERGKFAPGNSLAAAGGKAKAGRTRIGDRIGLKTLPAGNPFRPYKASAAAWRRAQCSDLAKSVGGGYCGPGPSAIVASAALALAWSRYWSDLAAETGDHELAAKAVAASKEVRASLRDAQALCADQAQARPKPDALAAMTARIDAVAAGRTAA